MTKSEIYAFLTAQGISYEITEHRAVSTMEELAQLPLPYPEDMGKNLFVCDKAKKFFYLITVKGEKRVDLKEFRALHGTRRLGFTSDADLFRFLGVHPGSVTPLGLLHDTERKVKWFVDASFFTGEGRIGVHPCENDATVWMKADDLVKLIQEHGNEVEITEV